METLHLTEYRQFHSKYGLRRAINILIKHNEPFHANPADRELWCGKRGALLIQEEL